MNIVHVSTTDSGGAGNVALSLTNRLNQRSDVNSTLLVKRKTDGNDAVVELPSLPFEHVLTYGMERFLSLEGLAAPSSFRITQLLRSFDADILHLHNLHGAYFNLPALLATPEDVKIVWTFHDMWPFTGNCVYARGCDRFESSCGSCPQLSEYPKLTVDTTSILLRLKRLVMSRLDVTAVCQSKWIKTQARRSAVDFSTTTHIPNGVDTDRLRPQDRTTARDHFDLQTEDRVLLFLADNIQLDRKGKDVLLDALHHIPESERPTLLVVGSGGPECQFDDAVTVRTPGYIPDELLPFAYSAADALVVPSLADNFPLTSLESMACGTPVIAFPTGGIPEQIVDGETGWLADNKSASALAETIQRAFADDPAEIRNRARKHVETSFEIAEIVDQYVDVYEDALSAE